MNAAELSLAIQRLLQVPHNPEGAWILAVEGSPTQVLCGAILAWRSGGGVTNVTDPHISRREAAQAILQARLTKETTDMMAKLNTSATRLALIATALTVIGTIAGIIQAWAAISK